MITIIAQTVLGLLSVGFIIASNRHIFRRASLGPQLSQMECVYYVIGAVSVVLAWYFNIRYASQYSTGSATSVWGDWVQYAKSIFANPAAGSVSQDYLIANLLLLPLFTIADGSRRGIRRPLLYFVASWFLTFTFAWAFYLATVDRQRRLVRSGSFEPSYLP
jgi:hypothetical protein